MVVFFSMADEAPKPEPKKEEPWLPVVLDTSVLFSYVCDTDVHHLSVESALGAIKPYKVGLCIPAVVLLEVMAKLIRQEKLTVSEAEKRLEKKLQSHAIRYESKRVTYKVIIGRYKEYAKSDVSKLKGIDFYIVIEAIGLGGLLLTCDQEMYDKAKTRHKNTFLLGVGQSISKLIRVVEKPLDETTPKVLPASS